MAFCDGPSLTTAFNKLPIELNKEIAHYLESDKDLCRYSEVCRATHDAIDGDNGSFWRTRFRATYAYKPGESNQVLKKKYQERHYSLHEGLTWQFSFHSKDTEEHKVQQGLIKAIHNMITESYQGEWGYDESGRPRCPNQVQLIELVSHARYFLGINRGRPSVLHRPLTVVQIMCAQFLFEYGQLKYDIYPFDDSQRMVYTSMRKVPLFYGEGKFLVNLDWVLHCMNFFRHHMMKEEAQSLYERIATLDKAEKPSAWREPLQDGCYSLSRYWKGTYSWLERDDMDLIRGDKKRKNGEWYFEDKNIQNDGCIQEMKLDFVKPNDLPWPQTLESRLQSLRQTMPLSQAPAPQRTIHNCVKEQSVRMTGYGIDAADDFFVSGWLNPLQPQKGIKGWQRVSFMKHFVDDLDNVMDDDLWAYEGVVLPGGRMMFGRWWYGSEDPTAPRYGEYSGPFMLWAADKELDLTVPGDSDDDN